MHYIELVLFSMKVLIKNIFIQNYLEIILDEKYVVTKSFQSK